MEDAGRERAIPKADVIFLMPYQRQKINEEKKGPGPKYLPFTAKTGA